MINSTPVVSKLLINILASLVTQAHYMCKVVGLYFSLFFHSASFTETELELDDCKI